VLTRALVYFTLALTTWFGAAEPIAAPQSARTEPFTIGVLRRDGIVIPFAAFDGRYWTSPWPADLRTPQVPASIAAVPTKWWGKAGPLETMTLWVTGENRGPVRVEAPTSVRVMCSMRVGLRSNYTSALPVPPSTDRSYPKDGVVVSGTTVIEPISVVPESSPEWAGTATVLIDPFDKAESVAADNFTRWKHPVPPKERQKVPIEIEALYKAPMDADGSVAYRFQAVKHYPAPEPGGDCGLLSSASGWILQAPDGKRSTQLAVRITYCDRMDDIVAVPLGLVHASGKSYWIYQMSGYDREGYAVSRPTPKGIEANVQYSAGSCPQ
jgi:hypothetical protein